jgi:TP901 family phage tail tape measure protein
MKLALTFTAVDAASGVVLSLERKILGMGKDAQKVKKDFEDMVSHMRAGLKSLAFSKYLFDTMKPLMATTADMEESMTNLEMTIARQGENAAKFHEELEKIRDTAGKLQLLFPFGQKEMINAATVLAKAGVDRASLYNEKGAVYSAGALASLSLGKLDAEGGARLVATGANIFDVKGDELSKMADYMQKVGSSSPLALETQAQALAMGGSAARIKGLNYREALTMMDVAATQSGDPSNAGGRLFEFMQRLMGASKQEKKALDALGLHFYDKKGTHLPIIGIVEQLQGLRSRLTAQGMTEEKVDGYIKQAFQGRGEYMASYLSKKGKGSYQERMATADESLSIAEKQAIAAKDANFQVRALTGSIQTLTADAFDPLLKRLTPAVVAINDLVGSLDSFVKEHKKVMEYIGGGIAAAILSGGGYGLYRAIRSVISLGAVLRGLGIAAGGTETTLLGIDRGLRAVGAGAAAAAKGTTLLAGALVALPQVLAGVVGSIVAIGSEHAAKENAKWQAQFYSRKQLDEMAGRNEVMGGGKDKGAGPIIGDEKGKRILNSILNDHKVWNVKAIEDAVGRVEQILKQGKKTTNINISVEQSGRVTSHSDDPSTTTTINLKRGRFLQPSFLGD